MLIQVKTDHTITMHARLDEHVRSVVESAVGRFGDHVSRVEVHLSNAVKEKGVDGGNNCMMEARVTGYEPVVVHDHGIDLNQSISNAAAKLRRALDSALGRLHDKNIS